MEEFDMEEIEQPDYPEIDEKEPKRTTFLLVLCILTFIGSGFGCLHYLMLPLVKGQIPEMMLLYDSFFSQLDSTTRALMNEQLDFMVTVPSWKYLLVALGFAGSVTGAALMLKLEKAGLHVYIISQILIFALLSFAIGGPLKSSIDSILWTITFILLYYLQLKRSNVKF